MVANPPSRGRFPYGGSDAVLAEAHRIAADIRRRAERDAIAVRREAAEWASATRREAVRYRERVLAELDHARAVAEETPAEPTTEAAEADEPAPSPVIDLRTAADARPMRLVETHQTDEPDPATGDDDEADTAVQEEAAEVERRPAVGGTYIVGRSLPPPATSIETKVHDVVRLAVRRTFHRQFP